MKKIAADRQERERQTDRQKQSRTSPYVTSADRPFYRREERERGREWGTGLGGGGERKSKNFPLCHLCWWAISFDREERKSEGRMCEIMIIVRQFWPQGLSTRAGIVLFPIGQLMHDFLLWHTSIITPFFPGWYPQPKHVNTAHFEQCTSFLVTFVSLFRLLFVLWITSFTTERLPAMVPDGHRFVFSFTSITWIPLPLYRR